MQETFKPMLSSSHVPSEPLALSINSISTQTKRKRALGSRMESHQARYAPVTLGLDSKQMFRRAPKVCPHLNHYYRKNHRDLRNILPLKKYLSSAALLPCQPPAKPIWPYNLTSQFPSDLLAAAACSSQGHKGLEQVLQGCWQDTAASAFTHTCAGAPRSQASSEQVNALQLLTRCSNQGLGRSP